MTNHSLCTVSARIALAGATSWLALTTGVAQAQEAPPQESDQAAASDNGDIVVTGSYLRRRQEDIATPIVTLGQDQIKDTGQLQVGDLTKYIPQNIGSTGGVQDLAKGGIDSRDARSANLRGLGAGATLVLLNGRRVNPYEGYVNLNALTPSIAIQRVETLLGGASSIYGADAVAGVVNVITNQKFEGFDATAQYTNLSKADNYQVAAMFGAGSGSFHVVTSAQYTYQGALQNADRAITNFFNPSSGTGANPGSFVLTARPQTSSGGDVIINNINYSTLYDARKNAQGTLTVVDPDCGSAATQSIFTPTAGGPGFPIGTCTFSYQAQNPLRPESSTLLTHTEATFDIAENHQLYAEAVYYHSDSKRWGVPGFAQNRNAGPGPVVPASNPYNPFGVPVQFIGRAIGSAGFAGEKYKLQQDEVNFFHVVGGFKGDLPIGDWQYNVDGIWSRASVYSNDRDTDMNSFQNALNGYGGSRCDIRWNGPGPGTVAGQGNCYYLSPFAKDDDTQNRDLIFNIQADNIFKSITQLRVLDAVTNGTLFDWGNGGRAALAIGGQLRWEQQSSLAAGPAELGTGGFQGPTRNLSFSRDVKSVFAELGITPMRGLDVNLSARYEDYGAFHNTSPGVEVNWAAVSDLLYLRGRFSKSFQAPSIQNATTSIITSGVGNVTDPLNGVTTFRTIATVGNPGLSPQKADVYNFGGTLKPTSNTSLSVDYWVYKYSNQIQLQSAQAVVNANPNGPQVIRDSNGVLQQVNVFSFNAPSGTQTSGIDFTASARFDVLGGRLSLNDTLSYLLKYDIDTGGGVVYDGVGRRNNTVSSPGSAAAAPRIRNVAMADFSVGGHSFNLSWRYASSIWEDYFLPLATKPTTKIRAWSVFDAQYGFRFGQNDRYRVDVGVINLFDTAPGSAQYTGYLSSMADALGRQVYVRAGLSF